MKKSIFFYSKNCIYSRKAIEFMQKANILSEFIKVDINDTNIKLPVGMNMVPCLAIVGETRLRQGSEVMEYLQNAVKSSEELAPINANMMYTSYEQDSSDTIRVHSTSSFTALDDIDSKMINPDEFVNDTKNENDMDSSLENFKRRREEGCFIPRTNEPPSFVR
jgi:hypothetical protein